MAEHSRDRALTSFALAPGIGEDGAQRLLSGLHAQLPCVPLITGWVDRDLAVEWDERAFTMSRVHPGNALLDAGVEARRDEAIATLGRLPKLEPRDASLLADLSVREVAQEPWRTLDPHGPSSTRDPSEGPERSSSISLRARPGAGGTQRLPATPSEVAESDPW